MDKYSVLKQYFGYNSFRQGQEQIIDSIINNHDVLAIMPTGAGKSLCFQIPALLKEGITIVVSPLVSLMKDQVMALVTAGVPAAFFNSSLSEKQYIKAIEYAKGGKYKIIYVAPERLLTSRFQNFVKAVEISMVAIDEAHCVSQWGQDFRPSYLQIEEFIGTLPSRPPVCAFTATATNVVKNDIINLLLLKTPTLVTTGFDRENLFFQVKKDVDKNNALLSTVLKHKGESGIVYCSTRKNVEEVCAFLVSLGVSATRYHAGLAQEERHKNQDDFLFDKKQVLVATNAFGMGIDKADVRFVVHYNMPKDMESYYQEAGRAGRDGSEATCLLLFDKKDVSMGKFLINNGRENDTIDEITREELIKADIKKLKIMTDYCNTRNCLREYILNYFGDRGKGKCQNCFNCTTVIAQPITSMPKNNYDTRLFAILKKVRKELAGAMGVPAFVIFSDNTLKDMCYKMPETKAEFTDVYGVGHVKTDQYAKYFIKAIKDYNN